MNEFWLQRGISRVHCIGIGGSGMAGIAQVLHQSGLMVSGSDVNESPLLSTFRDQGMQIFQGHSAEHIETAQVVVASAAIAADNPEYVAAKSKGLPVLTRAQMLAEIMRGQRGLAVAGTHGKTTTTGLLISMLQADNLDPTFVIGGDLGHQQVFGQLGRGSYCVVEACESDASFLSLHPVASILTNIDADHMQHYQGNMDNLTATFMRFLDRLPFYGLAVVCVDDPRIRESIDQLDCEVLTYGKHSSAQWRLLSYQAQGYGSHFRVKEGEGECEYTLALPGEHNALNAIAALAVAKAMGATQEACRSALEHFQGVDRRLHHLGRVELSAGGVDVINDYAHHPCEVKASLAALREAFVGKRLLLIFQPHRYTRTKALFADFVSALRGFDQIFLLPIYSAGEGVLSGASSEDLREALLADGVSCELLSGESALLAGVQTQVAENEVLIFMGAGSVGGMAQRFWQQYQSVCAVS